MIQFALPRAVRPLTARVARSAVAWSFVSVILRVASTILLLPLILRRIPPEHLGIWYIFLAIAALASLLDFGFAPTVSRVTAYAWAGAVEVKPLGPPSAVDLQSGGQPNYALLERLIATLRAYYRSVGFILFLIMTLGGGAWIWQKSAGFTDATSVRAAWVVYAIGATLLFMNSLWVDLLNGIGGIRAGQQNAVVGQILFYLLAIPALLEGFGLWSLVIASFVSGIATRSLLKYAFKRAAKWPGALPRARLEGSILRILWPTAWRTGLVSVASYTILQANTLICSAFLDLRTTASYGLTVQLITTLVTVSAIWVNVKMPMISQLRAQARSTEIASTFIERMRLSIVTYIVGALGAVFLLPLILNLIGSRTGVLPTALLAIFLAIQFLEMHHSLYAGLVYSENLNPFLLPALISGAFIVGISLLLTPRIGVWGLILSAGVVQLCFNNWWPVLRAVRGLERGGQNYWRRFFDLRDLIAITRAAGAPPG